MARHAAAATPKHCRRRARQQECAHRLELARQRQAYRRTVFRLAQPESKSQNESDRSVSPSNCNDGRRWRNGHSVASRTWCLDRHGFGHALAVEVEARENPSWLAAMTTIAHAASGSRIYVSSCDLRPAFAKPVAIGQGPYTSRHVLQDQPRYGRTTAESGHRRCAQDAPGPTVQESRYECASSFLRIVFRGSVSVAFFSVGILVKKGYFRTFGHSFLGGWCLGARSRCPWSSLRGRLRLGGLSGFNSSLLLCKHPRSGIRTGGDRQRGHGEIALHTSSVVWSSQAYESRVFSRVPADRSRTPP